MNKKIFFVFIIYILILTSCTLDHNKSEKPNTDQSQNKEDRFYTDEYGEDMGKITKEDIEPNINYIDFNIDKKMTEDVKHRDEDNKDVILNEDNSSNENIRAFDSKNLSSDFNAGNLIVRYRTIVPDGIEVDLRYNKYDIPFDYFLINTEGVKIFTDPNKSSHIIGSANFFSKIKLEGKVKGEYIEELQTDEWYLLSWMEEGETVYGYVMNNTGVPRKFRFDKMIASILLLEDALKNREYAYISNYKDRNGSPPLKNGKLEDEYGVQAYQSAAGYYSLEDKSTFRYIPDGMIVFIYDEQGEYTKVTNQIYDEKYWVNKKYISYEDNLDTLKKVVVVDKTNQNQCAFEKIDDNWTLISYTLATTGASEKYKFETPTGFFKVLQLRDKFYYMDHNTGEIGGYAPYGTRFTGGAYIHGVPVHYVKQDGKNIDPGMQEYLFTIGTTPRSSKCVRNYTSHAKFIYDWGEVNDTAVIVID